MRYFPTLPCLSEAPDMALNRMAWYGPQDASTKTAAFSRFTCHATWVKHAELLRKVWQLLQKKHWKYWPLRLPGDMFSSLSGRKSFQHVSAQTVHEISNSSHTALKYRYTAHDSLCPWHHVTVRGQRHVSDVIRHTCYWQITAARIRILSFPNQLISCGRSLQLSSWFWFFLLLNVSRSLTSRASRFHGSTVPQSCLAPSVWGGRNMPKHRTFH